MPKLTVRTVRGARRLQRTTLKGRKLDEQAPVPVDADGQPVALWGAAAGYVIAEDDGFDDDDQALVDAVDDDARERRGKLDAKDNTEREIRARLKTEIAARKKARADEKAARQAEREQRQADREQRQADRAADEPDPADETGAKPKKKAKAGE